MCDLRKRWSSHADGSNILSDIKYKRGIHIKLKKRTVLRNVARNSGDTNGGNESPTKGDSSIPQPKERSTNTALNGSDKFVLPGDVIGTTEEFRAGAQTYEKSGSVYAATTGTIGVNTDRRLVFVIPCTSTPPIVKKGDVVIGQVVGLRDSLAMVTIAGAKGVVDREIPNVGPAIVHVSNVKRAYVKDITYEFGMFDIVKAKIIDLKNMRLDTSEPDMGVIKALCSKCRTAMVRHDSKLKCPDCGRIETRKLSTGYRTGII